MTMCAALHQKSDVDRISLLRKGGAWGLISKKEYVKGKVNSLGWHFKCFIGSVMEGVTMAGTVETENAVEQRALKSARKRGSEEKVVWNEHIWLLCEGNAWDYDMAKSWRWIGQGDLKVSKEPLLCVVQEQAIRTKYVKFHIDKKARYVGCVMKRMRQPSR